MGPSCATNSMIQAVCLAAAFTGGWLAIRFLARDFECMTLVLGFVAIALAIALVVGLADLGSRGRDWRSPDPASGLVPPP